MRRRDFLKSGLISLAAAGVSSHSAFSQDEAMRPYVEGQTITLSNSSLDWQMTMTGGSIRSTRLRNKLSGRIFDLNESSDITLTFSTAKARVEIPWWKVHTGPDQDNTDAQNEQGYIARYHSEEYREEATWGEALNLLLLNGGASAAARPLFKGYVWFRQGFDLPEEAYSEPVTFCLGGYTQEDWNKYWIYVNGVEIGQWTESGRWREPHQLVLSPESDGYKKLRFGQGKRNLLAIRTFEHDKRFEGISDEVLDRFIFDQRLSDQFITVGQPYRHVSDFKLLGWRKEESADRTKCVFDLANDEDQLRLTLYIEIEGVTRRKWFEVKNVGERERLLLDVDLDDFRLDAAMREGDYGQPLIAADELFCAIEHPAGVNQGMAGRIRLRHFPGKKLSPRATFTSQVSLIGVARQHEGSEQFLEYIRSHCPRKKLLSIYDPLGTNGFPDSPCWTLDDREMLATMRLLEKWQKQGVKFDYYVPDVGWQDRTGGMTRFLPQCFPNGPEQVIQRANQLGMKWGLWFAGTYADWSIGNNPQVDPSRTVVPGGEWPRYTYRDGFPEDDGQIVGQPQVRHLCLASEPYFSMFRDGLVEHIKRFNLRFFKVDCSQYYCNSTEHKHLPGKYSTEANFDALIEIAKAAHQASSDLYIMWYGGIKSPFFLLHGDSMFQQRVALEAASTGDYPALFFRDATTLAVDQSSQFSEFVPPMSKDSLGIWITDTWWGNSMKKDRWREAAVMDLGRGSLLFPQLWGNLSSFDDEDVTFLARIQKLAKQNETILYRQRRILGDPWKNEVYGYAYFEDGHGLIFMNNMNFEARPVHLTLDESIGLEAPAGTRLQLREHFPQLAELILEERTHVTSGQTIETWLRPFEVALWEVLPDRKPNGQPEGLSTRRLPAMKPDVQSHRLALEPQPMDPGMEVYFAEPTPHFRSYADRPTLEAFKTRGYQKRIVARRAKLPAFEDPHVLAVVIWLRKAGKWWRVSQPADLIQASARVDDHPLQLEAVPSFRQSENNQSAPWLVFKIRTSPAWSGQDFSVALNAYLPPEVECLVNAWLVPEWWV
jgi:hypothetical protein